MRHFISLLIIAPLCVSFSAAGESSGDERSEEKNVETPSEPAELESITVTGLPFDISRDKLLRMVRAGLSARRSNAKEELDTLVCKKQRPTGSHIPIVACATNRTWMHQRGKSLKDFAKLKQVFGGAGEGNTGLGASHMQAGARPGTLFTVRGKALSDLRALPEEPATKAMIAPRGGIMPNPDELTRFLHKPIKR